MDEVKQHCSKKIFTGRGAWSWCTKRPTVQENGKWWCSLHCDAGVKKRREASNARDEASNKAWKARWDAENLMRHKAACFDELLEALKAMLEEKEDYMRRNHLGNPAHETTNKIAHAAIAKAEGRQ